HRCGRSPRTSRRSPSNARCGRWRPRWRGASSPSGGRRPFDESAIIVMMIVDMSELTVIQCCAPLSTEAMSDQESAATAAVFKSLGEPARVRIVNLLEQRGGPVCACEFEPALRLSQATVSHHLKKLTEAGLLDREQRGRWAYFSLSQAGLETLARLVRIPEVV